MYFGNSDGTSPFVDGLIEHNLVVDTIGYNMQIKHQLPRPTNVGLPTGDSRTIIRHNVFSKQNNAATGARAAERARGALPVELVRLQRPLRDLRQLLLSEPGRRAVPGRRQHRIARQRVRERVRQRGQHHVAQRQAAQRHRLSQHGGRGRQRHPDRQCRSGVCAEDHRQCGVRRQRPCRARTSRAT